MSVILVSTDIIVAHESGLPHSPPYTGASFYYDDLVWTYYADAFAAVHNSATSGEATACAWVDTGLASYHWMNCQGGGSVYAYSKSDASVSLSFKDVTTSQTVGYPEFRD